MPHRPTCGRPEQAWEGWLSPQQGACLWWAQRTCPGERQGTGYPELGGFLGDWKHGGECPPLSSAQPWRCPPAFPAVPGAASSKAAPLPPAQGTAARPLPHLCKHPPAGRENGPFVPSLAPVPQPSPSAAAPASATVGPGLAIVPFSPWATLGPPPPRPWGKRLHSYQRLPLQLSRRPPRLELWAVFLAPLGQIELQKRKLGRPDWGLSASLHLCSSSCFLSVSFVLVSFTPPWVPVPPLPGPGSLPGQTDEGHVPNRWGGPSSQGHRRGHF